MKFNKIVALVLALVMVFALCACGGGDTNKKDDSGSAAKVDTSTVSVGAVVIARDDVPTDQIYAFVSTIFNNLDAIAAQHGKGAEPIAKGYIQKEIQDSAYKWQMDIEKGDRIIVGVNKFQQEEEPPKNLLRVDGSVGKLQADKIAALKARRDNAKVEETLAALEKGCADESVNLMPLILDAVRAYATEGEICGVMRKVFGEYQSHTAL